MSTHDVDVAIVGGGCIGSSIFSELALRGLTSVALIDRGRYTTSATAHSAGMYRVFHEHPEHVSLALSHRTRFTEYQQRGLLQLRGTANGNLYFFNRERYAGYAESLQRMQEAGYPFEVVDARQGRKCFAQFRWDEQTLAIYEPTAGQTCPAAFADATLAVGASHGFTIYDDVEVTSVEQRRGVYRIASDQGLTVVARVLVLAGGAGMLPLLSRVAPGLELRAKTLTSFTAAKIDDEAPNYFDRETLEFGAFGSARSVTVSTRTPQRFCRPVTVVSEGSADDCYSSDRLGVRDPYPTLIVAAGWGGTAFKLALGIAGGISERIIDQLQTRNTSHVSA